MLKNIFQLLFSPNGNIDRVRFLEGMFYAFCLSVILVICFSLVMYPIYIIFGIDIGATSAKFAQYAKLHPIKINLFSYILGIIIMVMLLAMGITLTWCRVCLIVKRLRDLDVPVWFAAIPIMVEIDFYTATTALVHSVFLIALAICYLLLAAYPSRVKNAQH